MVRVTDRGVCSVLVVCVMYLWFARAHGVRDVGTWVPTSGMFVLVVCSCSWCRGLFVLVVWAMYS